MIVAKYYVVLVFTPPSEENVQKCCLCFLYTAGDEREVAALTHALPGSDIKTNYSFLKLLTHNI